MTSKLEKAISKMCMYFPFLRVYPLTWDIQQSDSVPTMAVCYDRLIYNPQFLESVSMDDAITALIHEAFHCVFLHPTEIGDILAKGKDWYVWMLSLEQVVNAEVLRVVDGRIVSTSWGTVSPIHLLTNRGTPTKASLVYDSKFDGMDEIAVYKELSKYKRTSVDRVCSSTVHTTSDSTTESSAKLDGVILLEDVLQVDTDESNSFQEALQKAIVTIEYMKKEIGRVPASLERKVSKLTQQQVPFERILRRFVVLATSGDDEYSLWKPDTRHPLCEEMFIPGVTSVEIEPPIVVVDTSASVSDKELNTFVSSIAHLFDFVREVEVITTDADVHERVKVKNVTDLLSKLKFRGGGGTDFRPVFDKIKNVSFVIFFTDGYATYPSTPPKYPVLWVLTKNHKKPPFGVVSYVLGV